MKYILSALVLMAGTAFAQNGEKTIQTRIERVTVYLEGAQIDRSGSAVVGAGRSTLKISGLSPYIDEKSIQVEGKGNITIVGVTHVLNYLEKAGRNAEIRSLEEQIRSTEIEENRLVYRNEVLLAKLNLLKTNQDLGGTEGATIEVLKQAIQFYDAALTDIKNEQLEVSGKITDLREKREDLENQLLQLADRREEPTGEIMVTVESEATENVVLGLSYSVANARWFPSYDIRVKGIEEPLLLSYKGNVFQQTGEDWENVQLRLSNGNPTRKSTAPTISTWWLRPRNEIVMYDDTILAEKALEGRVAGLRLRGYSNANEVMEEESDIEYLEAATIVNQTTVEFEVDRPYSVLSNKESIQVDLKSYEIDADYEYFAIPKLDKDAFLMARITDWDRYHFLDGEANLYFQGSFVGRTVLNARALDDTLSISLGRDRSIVVGRKKVETFTQKRVIGSNITDSRGFEITVRNNKNTEINLVLYDQLPLSASNEISVKPMEISGGSIDEKTGKVRWELRIEAGQQQARTLAYEVKYPKHMNIMLE